jgi:hypothetical protein
MPTVVGLLLGMETQVLEEQDLAWLEAAEGIGRPYPQGIAGDRHVAPKELRETLGNGPQPVRLDDLALGPTEVAGQDHRRALLEEQGDGRDRGPDARIVLDLAVLDGHVEVDADEHALAGGIEIADAQLVHVRRSGCRSPRLANRRRWVTSCLPMRSRPGAQPRRR